MKDAVGKMFELANRLTDIWVEYLLRVRYGENYRWYYLNYEATGEILL